MESITLQQILPAVFSDRKMGESDIWLQDRIFRKGKFYLIEAESGTGKSSLCSFLYGERFDFEGKIRFDSTEISSYSFREWTGLRTTSLSILFQDLRLFPELTSFQNVAIKNQLTGFKTDAEIMEMFERLNLADKREEPIAHLSFGQQQRVALIRALCQPFDFIILDEPVSHLDVRNAAIMADLVQEEAQKRGGGIIATSIGLSLPIHYHETFTL